MTVQQTLFLHISHLAIVYVIQVSAAEDFLAVLVLSWSQAPTREWFSTSKGKTTKAKPSSDASLSGLVGEGKCWDPRNALRNSMRFGSGGRVDVEF